MAWLGSGGSARLGLAPLSYRIVGYRVYHIIFRHIVAFGIVSWYAISHRIVSSRIISQCTLSYHNISYGLVSYATISCVVFSLVTNDGNVLLPLSPCSGRVERRCYGAAADRQAPLVPRGHRRGFQVRILYRSTRTDYRSTRIVYLSTRIVCRSTLIGRSVYPSVVLVVLSPPVCIIQALRPVFSSDCCSTTNHQPTDAGRKC